MALTPLLSLAQSGDCSTLTITDDTVYGAGNPNRNEVLVNFTVTIKNADGDTSVTLSYNPATVTSVVFSSLKDAWYRIVMTITDNPATWNYTLNPLGLNLSETFDRVTLCYSEKCFADKNLKLIKSYECGCEGEDDEKNVQKIANLIDAVRYKAEITNDLSGAATDLEKIQELCGDSDCGCS